MLMERLIWVEWEDINRSPFYKKVPAVRGLSCLWALGLLLCAGGDERLSGHLANGIGKLECTVWCHVGFLHYRINLLPTKKSAKRKAPLQPLLQIRLLDPLYKQKLCEAVGEHNDDEYVLIAAPVETVEAYEDIFGKENQGAADKITQRHLPMTAAGGCGNCRQ